MEGLELIRLDRRLVFVQVSQWVLGTVMMSIIVCIDGLSLKTSDRVEFLDGGCTQACQCTEYCALDLSNFRILDCINKGVLCLGSVILQLLGGVFLTKRRNLVEVHLQVMCHLLCKFVFRSSQVCCSCSCDYTKKDHCS